MAKTSGYSIHIYTVNCSDVYPGIPSVTHVSCAVLLYQLTETSTETSSLAVANEDTIYSVHEPTAQPSTRTIFSPSTPVQVALTVEQQGHLHHLSDTCHCKPKHSTFRSDLQHCLCVFLPLLVFSRPIFSYGAKSASREADQDDERPQVRNCCCLRPTPMEKMAVAYDVIEDTIRKKLN